MNCTPDSFFDGGKNFAFEQAWKHSLDLLSQGAQILDIGGESTRPGAEKVSAEQETSRVLPLVKALHKHRQTHDLSFLISVDTTKSMVAEQALQNGADIINDISMLKFDDKLPDVLLKHQPYIVLNHIRGTPATMQKSPYYKDVIAEVAEELVQAAQKLNSQGFPLAKIILDPGIGFSKKLEHNLKLIAQAKKLRKTAKKLSNHDFIWLYGMSRKSYIGNIPGLESSDRLIPSIVSALAVAKSSVEIVRVHDVKLTFEAFKTQRILSDFLY
ncbi:MAG: dihydropteroate synthase [Fibrobacter sp.]|nr:dihydropteroate synthase [Fibrobacter sp.]